MSSSSIVFLLRDVLLDILLCEIALMFPVYSDVAVTDFDTKPSGFMPPMVLGRILSTIKFIERCCGGFGAAKEAILFKL